MRMRLDTNPDVTFCKHLLRTHCFLNVSFRVLESLAEVNLDVNDINPESSLIGTLVELQRRLFTKLFS